MKEKIICMDGETIYETGNFEVDGYDLIWTSPYRDTAGGGHDRVFYSEDEGLYLVYTNKNGYEGTWGDLTDVAEFIDPENADAIYREINSIQNNQGE